MANKRVQAFVAALVSLAAVRCEAQDPITRDCSINVAPPRVDVKGYPIAWDYPGKVGPEATNPRGQFKFDVPVPAVSMKDRAPSTTMAKEVFGIVLGMPILAQPRGFDVWIFRSTSSIDDENTRSPRPH